MTFDTCWKIADDEADEIFASPGYRRGDLYEDGMASGARKVAMKISERFNA